MGRVRAGSGSHNLSLGKADLQMHVGHSVKHTQESSSARKVCTGTWLWSHHHTLGSEATGMDGVSRENVQNGT